MTITELIEMLEDAAQELGEDAEVRVAYQPTYPLRGTVANVTVPSSDNDPHCDDHICFVASCEDCQNATAAESAPGQDDDAKMCWIAVGSAPYAENPYGPSWAWQ